MVVVFYLFMIIGVVACDIYLQVTRRSDFGWCHLTRIPEVRLSYQKHPRPTGSEESVSRRLSYRMLVQLLEGCLLTDVCIPSLKLQGHSWGSLPLTFKPRRWVCVEGDLRCPGPPKKELRGESWDCVGPPGGESWDCVHVWVLFCVGNYVMFLVIDFCF